MLQRLVAIAGVCPEYSPQASRPLKEDEVGSLESRLLELAELNREVVIFEVNRDRAYTYLPKEEVLLLLDQHSWVDDLALRRQEMSAA